MCVCLHPSQHLQVCTHMCSGVRVALWVYALACLLLFVGVFLCVRACVSLCVQVCLSRPPSGRSAVCHGDASWQQGLLQWAHWSSANNLLSPTVSASSSLPPSLSLFSFPSCKLLSLLWLDLFPSHLYSLSSLLLSLSPFQPSPYLLKGIQPGYNESVNTGRKPLRFIFLSLSHNVNTSKGTVPSKEADTWDDQWNISPGTRLWKQSQMTYEL